MAESPVEPQPVSFFIIPADEEDQGIMRNLMHLYLYDFSEYIDIDVDEGGWFNDEYLERYWYEEGRYPYLLRAGDKWAGFALVRRESPPEERPPTHSIAEFFVMKKYRRHRIGQRMACQLFDRFPGRWWLEVESTNLPAQAFWRKVVEEYTGGRNEPVWDAERGHLRHIFENG